MSEQFKKAAKLTITYAFGNFLRRALSIFLLPLYTRYFSVKEFGILALLTISFQFASSIVYEPFTSALRRFYYKPEYEEEKNVVVFNLFSAMCIKTLLVTLLAYFISSHVSRILLGNYEYVSLIRYFCLILFFTPIASFLYLLMQMEEKAHLYVVVSVFHFLVSFISIYSALRVFKLGLISVPIGASIGYLFVFLLLSYFLFIRLKARFSFEILKNTLRFSYPLLPFTLSDFLMQYGDRYIIKMINGLREVGIYSFGYSISKIINILMVLPVSAGFVPAINKMEINPEKQKKFVSDSALYIYSAGVFFVIAFSLFSPEIISFFGRKKEYINALPIIPAVAFSYAQILVGNFLGIGMSMKMKSFHISGIMVFSAFINIVLNFLLIPFFGILGASIATLMAYIIWNVLKIYYSKKFYGLVFNNKMLAFITVTGLFCSYLILFVEKFDFQAGKLFLKVLILAAYGVLFRRFFLDLLSFFF